MKKILISIILLMILNHVWGQKDTTIIKLKDKKVIIIEEKQEKQNQDLQLQKESLEQNKKELETILENVQKQKNTNEQELEELQKQMEELNDDEMLIKLEEQLKQQQKSTKELEKQQEALERAIEELQKEIENTQDEFENFDWDDDEDECSDVVNIEIDNRANFSKRHKSFNGHWEGFEVGLDNWVNNDFKFALNDENRGFELVPEKSWVFSLNFLELDIPFGEYNGLVTGVGTTWNLYRFREEVILSEDTDGVIIADPHPGDYDKNKLMLWYMNVPLLYEFQIPVNRDEVHFSFGVLGSLKLMSKYTTKIDGSKTKDKSDFQIPGFKYGLTFRVGYKFINLFANYDMTPLFKENRGPELYPVSVGFVLSDW